MVRRRRFDSSFEWERGARYIQERTEPLSREDQRPALVQMVVYLLIVWGVCAAVILAWSLRFSPAFDEPIRRVVGGPGDYRWERHRNVPSALLALSERGQMLSRVPCYALIDRLHRFIGGAGGRGAHTHRCATLRALRRGGNYNAPRGPAVADARGRGPSAGRRRFAGTASCRCAISSLALERDSATRVATITALASLGDTSEQVLTALQRLFDRSRGEVRGRHCRALAWIEDATGAARSARAPGAQRPGSFCTRARGECDRVERRGV